MKKRVFDLALGALLVVGTAPFMAVLAGAVALTSGSPVIFRQPRLGLNGETFEIYKFRTMTNKTGPDGKLLSDLERVTALGRILRKTGLDELPQLYNILKGDMSFVGPRPRIFYSEKGSCVFTPEHQKTLSVRPGLTGPAQVAKMYNSGLSASLALAADFEYATKPPSLRSDLILIARTLPVLVVGNGSVLEGPNKG